MYASDQTHPKAGTDEELASCECEGAGDDLLVVDDSESSRTALQAALEPLGRHIESVASGMEAVQRLSERDYALVILDVVMPDLSGFETALMIRRRERSRDVPIIFLTGIAMNAADVLNGYELGCFDFLTKPVAPELLRAKVRVFLMLQERSREIERQARALIPRRIVEDRLRHGAELDARKNELLSTLAHELRTPLQSMELALELLRTSSNSDARTRARRTLEARVQQLVRVTDELLDISQLGTSAGKLELAEVSIDALVRAAVASREDTLFPAANRVFTVDAAAAVHVRADERRLARCITALIDRATMGTPPGGHVHVQTSTENNTAIVQVTDDGDGIDPKLLPRIFDLAVRERGAKSGAGALALGLAYVKHAIELHGGTVSAHSDGAGRGSTFRFELPIVST
jgi:signal transduction histidine kinase